MRNNKDPKPRTCPRCGEVVISEDEWFCQDCLKVPLSDRKNRRVF